MKLGYFDNAATTYQKPEGMYEYMSSFMMQNGVNVGRENNIFSSNATRLVGETRKLLLSLVHAPETREVVFCPSATIALNTILFGQALKSDDCVYISRFEHNAVLRVLHKIQKYTSINIKYIRMLGSDPFSFDLKGLEHDFAEFNPKLVIVSQVSNVVGNIAPVDEISLLAKKYNATTILDAAQACGLVDVNLHNIDYYVFAGHKTLLGPMGIGGFICDKYTNLQPYLYGGTGIDSANLDMPSEIPSRFEAGSLNLMAIAGLHYSLTWLESNIHDVREKEKANRIKLFDILSKYAFAEIVSPRENASSIVACRIKNYTSDEFGRILSERGIAVRTGLHCAPDTHKYLKSFPEGLVRFSISCLTTDEDFAKLDATLEEISFEL